MTKHLFEELEKPEDWDVLIGHYLGVDHAGIIKFNTLLIYSLKLILKGKRV